MKNAGIDGVIESMKSAGSESVGNGGTRAIMTERTLIDEANLDWGAARGLSIQHLGLGSHAGGVY
jgi:hypothetical protein